MYCEWIFPNSDDLTRSNPRKQSCDKADVYLMYTESLAKAISLMYFHNRLSLHLYCYTRSTFLASASDWARYCNTALHVFRILWYCSFLFKEGKGGARFHFGSITTLVMDRSAPS
ncbi:hypothetical protein DPSP01_003998 [Paraphaeosphaeria sporulosa]